MWAVCSSLITALLVPSACIVPPSTPSTSQAPQLRLAATEAYEVARKVVIEEYPGAHLTDMSAGYIPLDFELLGGAKEVPDIGEDGKCSRWELIFFLPGFVEWRGDELVVLVQDGKVKLERGRGTGTIPIEERINLDEWEVDSPQAVQIALDAGGKEFDLIKARLRNYSPLIGEPRPEWSLSFGSTVTSQTKGLLVLIHAGTGEVREILHPEYRWMEVPVR